MQILAKLISNCSYRKKRSQSAKHVRTDDTFRLQKRVVQDHNCNTFKKCALRKLGLCLEPPAKSTNDDEADVINQENTDKENTPPQAEIQLLNKDVASVISTSTDIAEVNDLSIIHIRSLRRIV